MPDSQTFLDPMTAVVVKVVPATLGTVVSLGFIKGTALERLCMTIGGISLAYYATPVSAHWLNMGTAEGVGLVGFSIGLFGMTLVAKIHEALQAIDAIAVGKDLWNTAKKRLGIGA